MSNWSKFYIWLWTTRPRGNSSRMGDIMPSILSLSSLNSKGPEMMCTTLATLSIDLNPIPFSPMKPFERSIVFLVLWPMLHRAFTFLVVKAVYMHLT